MNLCKKSNTSESILVMCLVMIFMIVLTGMCCRIGQADSLFCAVTGQTQVLLSTEKVTDASEICTQDLLKRAEAERLSNNRMVRTRTDFRIVLFFMVARGGLQCLKKILRIVRAEGYEQICSNTVIVNYIHHQDGESGFLLILA